MAGLGAEEDWPRRESESDGSSEEREWGERSYNGYAPPSYAGDDLVASSDDSNPYISAADFVRRGAGGRQDHDSDAGGDDAASTTSAVARRLEEVRQHGERRVIDTGGPGGPVVLVTRPLYFPRPRRRLASPPPSPTPSIEEPVAARSNGAPPSAPPPPPRHLMPSRAERPQLERPPLTVESALGPAFVWRALGTFAEHLVGEKLSSGVAPARFMASRRMPWSDNAPLQLTPTPEAASFLDECILEAMQALSLWVVRAGLGWQLMDQPVPFRDGAVAPGMEERAARPPPTPPPGASTVYSLVCSTGAQHNVFLYTLVEHFAALELQEGDEDPPTLPVELPTGLLGRTWAVLLRTSVFPSGPEGKAAVWRAYWRAFVHYTAQLERFGYQRMLHEDVPITRLADCLLSVRSGLARGLPRPLRPPPLSECLREGSEELARVQKRRGEKRARLMAGASSEAARRQRLRRHMATNASVEAAGSDECDDDAAAAASAAAGVGSAEAARAQGVSAESEGAVQVVSGFVLSGHKCYAMN